MTIRELKDIIDGIDEEHLDEEVYLLIQPNWPFVYDVSQADHIPNSAWAEEFEDLEPEQRPRDQRPGLYLAEGSQLGYASQIQCDYFGWR